MEVAAGKKSRLKIFGNDYATLDGTGLRDYLHIDDLAEGHIAAICYLSNMQGNSNFDVFSISLRGALSLIE